MDNQWHHHHHHHHQAVQGNICPTCSISHFPFCPPHPASFNQNPRFPSPQDHPFHGPGFDPYRLSTGPYHHRPNDDGYRDPISWHKNPNLDRDSRGYGVYSGSHVDGFTPLPMPYDYTSSGGNGFPSGGDRNIKRMRVDDLDSDSGVFVNEYHVNSLRVMSELDERRLKLIRDHGGASSDPSQSGANSFTDFNQEIDSVSERRFTGTSFREHGIFNYLQGSRVESAFKSPTNMAMHDFQDPGFGSGEKKRPFLHLENVPSSHSYSHREENRYDIPIEQGHQHHETMVRHSAEMADRYYSTPLKGDCDRKPHISQQGPCPFPEALSERNDFLSGAPYNEQRSRISTENWASNDQPLGPYKLRHPMHSEYDFHSPSILNDTSQSSEVKLPSREGNQFPFNINNQGSYLPIHSGSSMISENPSQMHGSRMICAPPPLPPSPPPPLPVDSPGNTSLELKAAYIPHLSQPYFPNKSHLPVSTGFVPEESHAIRQPLSQQYSGEGQLFPLKHLSTDKRKTIDASDLVKQPHRATRPDHIVIILRGLPGSGKSYLAKMFRDLEVENGGDAPRIHSMDDYFMTEVEKVDESEMAKSTSSGRGKKPTTKKVMEYCYEPEMEEAYRSSMLKAFRKTLEEGVFTFIIVDDRNLRVADFAQFWAIAKRSGYEVYLLEATYKDPVGCAARNVHGFSQDEIQKMARQWEEAPSWYLQLDVKSLFHGDDLKDGGIQEVDMDTEDRDLDEGLTGWQVEKHENRVVSTGDHATTGSSKDEERWDGDGAEGDHPTEQVKELGRSKWSDAFDEDDDDRTQIAKGNLNSLSGLIQAYAKDGKSVQWGDQAGNTGFAIGAAKKAKALSLVIGPGAGYNLKSNPLPEVNPTSTPHTGERHGIFQEQLRAERESSKAIFDRRRHKIGLNVEED